MRTRSFSSSDPVSPPEYEEGKRHQPVLLHEVMAALDVQADDIVVDATLGGAGHAEKLIKGLRGNGLFIGFDQDADATHRAAYALQASPVQKHLIVGNFRDLARELAERNVARITKVLFDLGWSSYQLDSERGFSFMKDEPLLMTYAHAPKSGQDAQMLTARAIVNTWDEKTLANVIYAFGQERYARRIAKRIVEERGHAPIQTSKQLAGLIESAVPQKYRHGRIHPATRTFQALRMATNDEIGALEEGLNAAWKLLATGGRIAVISFHSVEDRIVKQKFLEWEKQENGKRITKKPISASKEEVVRNPRARSAKLRAIEKTQNTKNSHENSNSKNKQIRTLDFPGED